MIFGGVAGCLGWLQRAGTFFVGGGAGKTSGEMQAAASGIRPTREGGRSFESPLDPISGGG